MAVLTDLYSNHSAWPLTAKEMRALAMPSTEKRADLEPRRRLVQNLFDRLGQKKREEVVRRYQGGEDATAIAKDLGVAPSALIRLLRGEQIAIRKERVSLERAEQLKQDYEAGATVAQLVEQHKIARGSVLRALHRTNTAMRSPGRQARPTQEAK